MYTYYLPCLYFRFATSLSLMSYITHVSPRSVSVMTLISVHCGSATAVVNALSESASAPILTDSRRKSLKSINNNNPTTVTLLSTTRVDKDAHTLPQVPVPSHTLAPHPSPLTSHPASSLEHPALVPEEVARMTTVGGSDSWHVGRHAAPPAPPTALAPCLARKLAWHSKKRHSSDMEPYSHTLHYVDMPQMTR